MKRYPRIPPTARPKTRRLRAAGRPASRTDGIIWRMRTSFLRIPFLAFAFLAASLAFAQAPAPRPAPIPDVIFVPTPQDVVDEMLRLADVKKGDVLYDLGSGDGRIPVTAAKRYGVR